MAFNWTLVFRSICRVGPGQVGKLVDGEAVLHRQREYIDDLGGIVAQDVGAEDRFVGFIAAACG